MVPRTHDDENIGGEVRSRSRNERATPGVASPPPTAPVLGNIGQYGNRLAVNAYVLLKPPSVFVPTKSEGLIRKRNRLSGDNGCNGSVDSYRIELSRGVKERSDYQGINIHCCENQGMS